MLQFEARVIGSLCLFALVKQFHADLLLPKLFVVAFSLVPNRIKEIPSRSVWSCSALFSSSSSDTDSSSAAASATTTEKLPKNPILDDVPSELKPLFACAAAATTPRTAVTTSLSHDPFRFEWGTWVDNDAIAALMDRVNEIRCWNGVFEKLLEEYAVPETTTNNDSSTTKTNQARRLRVAGGQDWDVILHVLPQQSFWRGRWPTGSWSILKPLIGVTEVAMLRESNLNKKATTKDLRGGSDSSRLGGGGGGSGSRSSSTGVSTGGEDCVKYVGGPIRSYTGKSGKTILLEVIIRPPISNDEFLEPMEELQNVQEILSVVVLPQDDNVSVDNNKSQQPNTNQPLEATINTKNDSTAVSKGETTTSKAQSVSTKETAPSTGNPTIEAPIAPPKTPPTETITAATVDAETSSTSKSGTTLGSAMGMTFEQVGGLDDQLDAIARRVLASRANPEAARRLGVSHVRGILLSGPPGCGKTLLARELARLLDAREPQIVNGPEILDKFIGEAEKNVRALFAPAQREYAELGDGSALHIIVLDEMDAIAKKRGSVSSDTTGVRDSVVNQLLSCMDGITEANNVLVVGLTNRPELIDPAMLRPGRLEVQLRVELPDRAGRRDILRIHTRQMKQSGALSAQAIDMLEDMSDAGIPARTEHFSGAEIAGLVRSAASFALARTVQDEENAGIIAVADLEKALKEVLPALGKQDEVLRQRFPLGISPCSLSMERIMRDLQRFTTPKQLPRDTPRIESLLVVGAGNNGGAGATALAAWAAAHASTSGTDYVRLITALDLISAEGGGGDEARAAALVDRFGEAREMSHSLLVLDDVDQLCAGSGPGGYSNVMLATLRALLRTPPDSFSTAKAGGESQTKREKKGGKTLQIIGATSRSDSACRVLNEIFDETLVVPLLSESQSVCKLFADSLAEVEVANADAMAELIIDRLGSVGCKTALRLAERAVATAAARAGDGDDMEEAQLTALQGILEDLAGDEVTAEKLCEVF